MASRPLSADHPDYSAVAPVAAALIRNGGGEATFASDIPALFRQAIDEVIDAPRTNRFTIEETEKTEKTYLGTKIEILLRNGLGMRRGKILDLDIDGVEVDIKNTMRSNWSIPMEAVGHPALLVRVNEATAKCDVGLILIRDDYLNLGANRDQKRTVSIAGQNNIWWLLRDHKYPPNFWEVLSLSEREKILAAGAGTLRIAALFEKIQGQPISRLQVQALAQQHDYMKRVRRNGGARDILAPKGIALLWGKGDMAIILALGLGPVGADQFISYKAMLPREIDLLRLGKHID